jgi:hypothetical protein
VAVTTAWAAKGISWTSAAGATVSLTDSAGGYISTTGRAGFGPVDAQIVSDQMWDGSTLVRTHRVQPRLMTVPLYVMGPDAETYLARLRALQATLRHPVDPSTNLPVPGRVAVQLPDGSQRSIAAFYQGGAAPTESDVDDVAAGWCSLPNLQFYAPVPTWEGDTVSRTWQLAPSSAGVPPMPPVLLGSGAVIGASTVTNPGDTDAYPIWTITGPGTVTVTNSDTGQSYAFTQAIPAGTVVTVDCRPVELAPSTGLTATDAGGTDWWPHLADYPNFWTLPPGDANLSITVTGATAASSVTVEFAPRYLGAW